MIKCIIASVIVVLITYSCQMVYEASSLCEAYSAMACK